MVPTFTFTGLCLIEGNGGVPWPIDGFKIIHLAFKTFLVHNQPSYKKRTKDIKKINCNTVFDKGIGVL